MSSPEKPFACTAPECGHTFTTEGHLSAHSKKHEMALQLGQKVNAFPADQTPTPTRFIRNCEEVGLFQELQNVNPFDEGFKRAMEAEGSILISLDNAIAAATSDDALHTPHIFPNLADVPDSGLFTASTKKLTVTRSSSDETTTAKHFESIETKLTNEVTIETHNKNDPPNNTITIQSNIKINKTDFSTISANDPNLSKVDNDFNVVRKDVMLADTGKNPVMSQQSLDFAIDSLTSHVDDVKSKQMQSVKNLALIDTMKKNVKSALENASKNYSKTITIESKTDDKVEVKRKGKKRRTTDITKFRTDRKVDTYCDNYEVMLRLPNGELVHMKSGDNIKPNTDTKQKLKDAIESKIKTEIENKIRMDLESKIKDEILQNMIDPKINKLASPSTFADKAAPILVPISPKVLPPYGAPFPVALISAGPKNVFVPTGKVPIPPDIYANKLADKKPREKRAKLPKQTVANNVLQNKRPQVKLLPKTMVVKSVSHKPHCIILTKIGGQCSLNCAEEVNPNRPPPVNNFVSTLVTGVTVVNNVIDKNKHSLNANQDKDISKNKSEVCDEINSSTAVVIASVSPAIICKDSTNCTASVINDCKLNTKQSISTEFLGSDKNKTINEAAPQIAEVKSSLPKRRYKDYDTFKRESQLEAVRRYRARQKHIFEEMREQNKKLTLQNGRLSKELDRTRRELAALKQIYMDHCESCGKADDLRANCLRSVEIKVLRAPNIDK